MDEIVGLNVGGRVFITSLPYLMRYPDSMLAAMFDSEHLGEKNGRRTDKYGNVVIDRSGELFRYVFYYLRTSILLLPDGFKERELDLLVDEARFYRLPELEEAIFRRKLLQNGKTFALVSTNTKHEHSRVDDYGGGNKKHNSVDVNFVDEPTKNQCKKQEHRIRPLSPGNSTQDKPWNTFTKTIKGSNLNRGKGAHPSHLQNQSSECVSTDPSNPKCDNTLQHPDDHSRPVEVSLLEPDATNLRTNTNNSCKSSKPQPGVADCEDLPAASFTVPKSTTNTRKSKTPELNEATSLTSESIKMTEEAKVKAKTNRSVEPEYPQLQWFEYVYLE